MKPLVIDTSVWIDWGRGRHGELRQHTQGRLLLMPAVVCMELLSGARDRRSLSSVNALLLPFVRHRRVVLPSYDDFALAGELIAELQWAASKRANDVLIATLARKAGAALLTTNLSDFEPVCRLLDVEML